MLVFSAWATKRSTPSTGPAPTTATPSRRNAAPLRPRRTRLLRTTVLLDDTGRRIVFGWLQEERPTSESVAAGWSGAMSLPRIATWHAGAVHFAPASEVAALRTDHYAVVDENSPVVLSPGDHLDGPSGLQLDLDLQLRVPPGAEANLTVLDGHAERTVIKIRRTALDSLGQLTLDRSTASLNPQIRSTGRDGTFPIGTDDRIHLRVLIDHSVLEIFANGQPLTARVYPTRPRRRPHEHFCTQHPNGSDRASRDRALRCLGDAVYLVGVPRHVALALVPACAQQSDGDASRRVTRMTVLFAFCRTADITVQAGGRGEGIPAGPGYGVNSDNRRRLPRARRAGRSTTRSATRVGEVTSSRHRCSQLDSAEWVSVGPAGATWASGPG